LQCASLFIIVICSNCLICLWLFNLFYLHRVGKKLVVSPTHFLEPSFSLCQETLHILKVTQGIVALIIFYRFIKIYLEFICCVYWKTWASRRSFDFSLCIPSFSHENFVYEHNLNMLGYIEILHSVVAIVKNVVCQILGYHLVLQWWLSILFHDIQFSCDNSSSNVMN
jgi:hypothetical protein